MTADIEECLAVVVKALKKSDLPPADMIEWCDGMLKATAWVSSTATNSRPSETTQGRRGRNQQVFHACRKDTEHSLATTNSL